MATPAGGQRLPQPFWHNRWLDDVEQLDSIRHGHGRGHSDDSRCGDSDILLLGVTEGAAVLGVGQLGLRDRRQTEDMGEGPEGPHLLQGQGLDVRQTRSRQSLYARHRHVSGTQTQSLSMQAHGLC